MHNVSPLFSKLALYGGEPVRKQPWPTYDKGDVIIDDDDINSVVNVLKNKRLFRYDTRTLDETQVGQFEKALREFFGIKYALAVSSGTAALSLSLMSLELPSDSLIGCPTFTFTATPSAILLAKLKPCLIKVDRNLQVDLADLEEKIPTLKALVVVHMRGYPAPLLQIKKIADQYNVPVIEDAVPALGGKLAGKYLGTHGLMGAFSMQSDKSLNTGEGGFILTDNKILFQKCVVLSGAYESLNKKHFEESDYESINALPVFNFRLDEMRGALGLSQLKKLFQRTQCLSENYQYIAQGMQRFSHVALRENGEPEGLPLGDHLLIKVSGSIEDSCWFAKALTAEGIDTMSLGDAKRINVRRFWDWDYLFQNKSKSEIQQLHSASYNHISSYIDIALSPTLKKEDLDTLLLAISKVHAYYAKGRGLRG